jgi:hypothetical protein
VNSAFHERVNNQNEKPYHSFPNRGMYQTNPRFHGVNNRFQNNRGRGNFRGRGDIREGGMQNANHVTVNNCRLTRIDDNPDVYNESWKKNENDFNSDWNTQSETDNSYELQYPDRFPPQNEPFENKRGVVILY